MGFTKDGYQTTPVPVLEDTVIVKIASGSDHLVCLSDKGEIWTMGMFLFYKLYRISLQSYTVQGPVVQN